jgi:hypothetical protein
VSAIVPALGARSASGRSKDRKDHRELALLLQDEQRQPLSDGNRGIAGEIDEAGPGRDEDAGQSRRG